MRHRDGHPEAPARPRRGGFTLIELLTVIAIIGLLVSMVVPTLRSVFRALEKAKTRVRIQTLNNGAYQYRMEATGNKFFPGQEFPELIQNRGSAYLARALYTDANDFFPTGTYAAYEKDMLDDETGAYSNNVPYTILDTYPDPMPILYYPAWLSGAQYRKTDNNIYLNAENDTGTFASFVMADNNVPNNSGEFLVFAAGRDRKYFSADDVKNWK